MNELWPNGCTSALSVVLDGGLADHLELVRSVRYKVTLCVTPEGVLKDPKAWQQLSRQGHEIGNSCLFGVTENGRLSNWSLRTVEQELHMTQQFLHDLFPWQEPVTFSYPGPETACANGDYRSIIPNQFLCAVSHESGLNHAASEFTYLKVRDVPASEGWSIVRVAEQLPQLDASIWVAPVREIASYLQERARS